MKKPALFVVLLAVGCGGQVTQFESKHQELLKRLQRYVQKQDGRTCKQLCKRFEEMHKRSQLTDEQFQALNEICTKVQDWQWDEAKELIDTLVAGQDSAAQEQAVARRHQTARRPGPKPARPAAARRPTPARPVPAPRARRQASSTRGRRTR